MLVSLSLPPLSVSIFRNTYNVYICIHVPSGCRRREEDLLYGEEMEAMLRCGTLSALHLALSRAVSYVYI